MLVSYGNIEHRTCTRNKKPPRACQLGSAKAYHVDLLVAISNQEIWIEVFEVQVDESNAVSPVDNTKDAVLAADFSELLKRHPHSWHAHNGIKDCHLDMISMFSDLTDEARQDVFFSVCQRIKGDFKTCNRRGLSQIINCLANRPVYATEKGNLVSRLKSEVAQDGVEASRRVRDEDDAVNISVEKGSNLATDLVQLLWEHITNEFVRLGFGSILPMPHRMSNRTRVRAISTWEQC